MPLSASLEALHDSVTELGPLRSAVKSPGMLGAVSSSLNVCVGLGVSVFSDASADQYVSTFSPTGGWKLSVYSSGSSVPLWHHVVAGSSGVSVIEGGAVYQSFWPSVPPVTWIAVIGAVVSASVASPADALSRPSLPV